MSNDLTVGTIVAQIRSRIAEENAQKSSPSQTRAPGSEGAWNAARCRQRREEDSARFADLDARIEKAARNVGQQPPTPSTLRGRVGAAVVQGLRRVLWWYGLPIKEALAQIGIRNREQANRHRRLQEDVLALGDALQTIVSRMDRCEQAYSDMQSIRQSVVDCRARLGSLAEEVESRLNDLQRAQDRAAKETALLEEKLQHVAGSLEPLAGLPVRVSNLGLAQEKQQLCLRVQENRVAMFLRELRQQRREPLSAAQMDQVTEASTDGIAAVYADFEDTFRGPRELIKERLRVYVPRLIDTGVGLKSAPVLDLGCGRGEWLELLADHKLTARGVDSNPAMIERCRALSLDVVQTDALTHLRSLPDGSVGAVTSFHMVEHMPFEAVIALLDEALRVLKSGGLLILETPSPQNVLVGSQTFWIDPTHVKPIPSQTLRFYVEARGFCDAEVWNLQPYPEAVRLPEDQAGIGSRFNEYFYGPQDYSVIARRL